MAFTVRTVPEFRLRIITVAETVEEAALISACVQLTESPDYNPAFDVLADVRGTKEFRFDSQAVMPRLVELFNMAGGNERENSRAAIVATSDLGFGLSRMYGSYRDSAGGRFKVFRDMSEATEWLGVPTTVVEQ